MGFNCKALPGRTDNANRNHWNSTLRRRYMELGRFNPGASDMMEDCSLEGRKASSAVGGINSFKLLEGKDAVMDNRPNLQDDKPPTQGDQPADEPKDHHTLCRPVARLSAYGRCNPPSNSRTQSSRLDWGAGKISEDLRKKAVIPLRCGVGCCSSPCGAHSHNSLLGPEFVDHVEPPCFSSRELISIPTDLNNIAWIKSGLENSCVRISSNATGQRMSQGAASGM